MDKTGVFKSSKADFFYALGYAVLFLLLWVTDLIKPDLLPSLIRPESTANVVLIVGLVIGVISTLFRSTRLRIAIPGYALAVVLNLMVGGTLPMFVFLFEIIFCGTLYGSPRTSQGVKIVAWVLAAVPPMIVWIGQWEPRYILLQVLQSIVAFIFPLEWASNLRRAGELLVAEKDRAAAVEEAAEQRTRLELELERQKMAREIHDVLSARLSAIAMQSAVAIDRPEHVARSMELIRSESVEAVNELSTMVRMLDLGATASTVTGKVVDISTLVEKHQRAGACLEYRAEISADLAPEIQSAVYRIVSEGLNNAVKYGAGAVKVRLSDDGRQVSVQVANQVSVPSGQHGTGVGIASMKARATHLGGTLSSQNHDGMWLLQAEIPLAPVGAGHE